ncbi:MAG: DUF222 domain-containing protein [Candidatus Nanopelagicales bacterium]
MSSTTPPGSGAVTVAAFCAAVEQVEGLAAALGEALDAPERFDLGAVPADLLAGLTTRLLRAGDRLTASATVMTAQVTAVSGPGTGSLIAGRYASPRRWLELDAGLAPHSAKAVLARARDLREHSRPIAREWLTGEISGDSVRELTSGVTGALKQVRTTREIKEQLRAEAIDVLLPVAVTGTPADTRRAVARLRLLADSAYEEQAKVEAYDDQSLTCVEVGDLSRITAWLTHESAAAFMTVVEQHARRIADEELDVTHDAACPLASPAPADGATRWCTCGASAAAGVTSKDRWPHVQAVALGQIMRGLLDRREVGSHHGVAPHVTLTVDLDRLEAGLGGDLAMPGRDDPVVVGTATARRIICDSSVTPVVIRRRFTRDADASTTSDATDGAPERETCSRDDLVDLLREEVVDVLYVGRTHRTVTPRQRRAVEVRDRHCIFPGCRAHPRRCQVHHVVEWENHGSTDIDNLALLCVRHHVSVHEGGWTITRTPGTTPYETGCWTLAPPRPQP